MDILKSKFLHFSKWINEVIAQMLPSGTLSRFFDYFISSLLLFPFPVAQFSVS